MIIIGIALLAFSMFLLIFAWRGRIVGRGQFCRKCKFDLTGSPIDTQGNKCPECGQPIHTQSSRRTTLRRSSKPGLIVVAFLLLAGLTTTGIGITGNSAAVYAKMPDGIIVRLSTIGSGGALDELVNRLTRVPPLSNAHWDRLIDYALKIQADPQAPWKPVIGEILADAWITNRLTDEQINQYLDHALDIQFLMRDRAVRGSTEIQLTTRMTPARIHSLNGTQSGYSLKIGIVSSSIGKEPTRPYRPDGKTLWISHTEINIPNTYSNWSYSNAVDIRSIAKEISAQPGTDLPITVNVELALVPSSLTSNGNTDDTTRYYKAITINKSIRILEEGTPLVDTKSDPLSIQNLKEQYTISAIRMLAELDPDRKSWTPILGFSIMINEGLSDSLAFRAFLRVTDGAQSQEIEIAKVIHEQTNSRGSHGTAISWRVDPDDPEKSKQAADIVAMLKKIGKADIILRSDPTIAEGNPTIDSILDTTLVFRDVSINLVDTYGKIWMTTLNERQWHASNED